MALKPCRECGRDISTEAKTCPHCGVADPAEKKSWANQPISTGKGCLVVLLLLALATCFITILDPAGDDGGTTTTVDLAASVRFTGSQFEIQNLNDFDWTNCEFDLNGGIVRSGFTLQAGTLEAGSSYSVGAGQLADRDGQRFNPLTMKPQTFSLACDTPSGRGFYTGQWE